MLFLVILDIIALENGSIALGSTSWNYLTISLCNYIQITLKSKYLPILIIYLI